MKLIVLKAKKHFQKLITLFYVITIYVYFLIYICYLINGVINVLDNLYVRL